MLKNNITIFCVLDNYGTTVAKMLSDKLGMYYADILDMFEYELIDTKHIINSNQIKILEFLKSEKY